MLSKPKRKYTKLSKAEFDSIVAIYSCGGSTLLELSEKYGVSVGTLMNQAKARGATRRASFPAMTAPTTPSTVSKTVASATAHTAPRSLATTAERIAETNDSAYLDAAAIQGALRAALAALPIPTTPAELAATIRSMDQAATALDRCNKIRRLVLRLDRENFGADVVLPDLPIIEMTQLEVYEMRAAQESEDRQLGLDAPEPDDAPEEPDDDNDVVAVGE